MLDCTERHILGVLGNKRRLKSGSVAHYWLSDARYSTHISSIASQSASDTKTNANQDIAR